METQLNNNLTFSGPRDKSVGAHKDWIMGIAERVTTDKNTIKLTETDWLLNWRGYWKEKMPANRVNEQYSS
jgi:hypothetical protein